MTENPFKTNRDSDRSNRALPATFTVVTWERHDHDISWPVDHAFFERCYTPVLGPTAVVLLRRLVEIAALDAGTQVQTDELAVAVGARAGSGAAIGQRSPLHNAIKRLVRSRLASWLGSDALQVVTHVPPLPSRMLERLPRDLQQIHERHLALRSNGG